MTTSTRTTVSAVALALACAAFAPPASARGDLTITANGATDAVICVAPEAGAGRQEGRRTIIERKYERQAADDLAKYIELMSGARPVIADTKEAIAAALKGKTPVFVVGELALETESSLNKKLASAAKERTFLRADGIVCVRKKNRVYLAGLNDDAHYHAVAELLRRWGCRWYIPTEIGECIPVKKTLTIGKLDYAYASPLEMRSYWISWNGSNEGQRDFQVRNFMTPSYPQTHAGHALGHYTKELVPEGRGVLNVPIAEEKTIEHVAAKIEEAYQTKESISLGIADGVYDSASPVDHELKAGIYDKYFVIPNATDMFMTLYNGVCERMAKKYPDRKTRFGFLAYSNLTLPPQRVLKAAPQLFCSLAPIDIDPNHGMDDPRSPPRQEYREMMYRWAEVMDGRVWIYDYDQGMLVWRDIPNPSHQAFVQDVKHYAKAGIMGILTESRNAIATTFLNLHLRGQLMWNPDLSVESHLAEFYPLFYGPAAEPMSKYWTALFKAWEDTIVTEHEFFAAPAIYTRTLMEELRRRLEAGEKVMGNLNARSGELARNDQLFLERVKFARLGFDLLDAYLTMVFAGGSDCDFKKAHEAGKRGLTKRLELGHLNSTFTTRVVKIAKEPEYGGSPAWWPGEVKLYGDLEKLTDGTEGTLVTTLPLEWAFHRDPNDTGLALGWAYQPDVDLAYWKEKGATYTLETRKDYPTTEWEMLRTDLYMQAQGVLHPDRQAYTGYAWYRTTVDISKKLASQNVHIRFPGLFANCWLYVNGALVAYRPQKPMWWQNSYGFQWDVDLTGKLNSGENLIVVRNHVKHHVGGMFRRAFLYVGEAKD